VKERAKRERLIRHIQPLGPRVLVRVLPEEDMSDSGLYLPAGAKERTQEALYGEVVEVARAAAGTPSTQEGLGVNVSGVPCGARVLFLKSAGTRVPWDEALRILEVKEVLATVEEVPEAEAH
jgi:co-chaperonin GroES (HSP10)